MWDIEKLQTIYSTDIKEGLTTSQALAKLKINGFNELTEKKGKPWWLMFLKELTGFFQCLLWAGCVLALIGYGIQPDKEDKSNIYLAVVIAAIVIVIACFSYSQSSKAASLMADFKNFIPREALVFRDGV